MSKGTESMGRKSGKKSHVSCRRCGRMSMHHSRGECSSCGFGKSTKMRSYTFHRSKA